MRVPRRPWTTASALLLASCVPSLASPLSYSHPPDAYGAVASEATECSEIGQAILTSEPCGNAVDAIIATTFCVGVVGMYHSGIGGGGFAVVRDADGSFEAFNFRESAPASAYEDMYRDNVNGSVSGGLSVATPGELQGMWHLYKKYGSKPWGDLLEGAIRVAQDGFTVNKDLYKMMVAMEKSPRGQFLVYDPVWSVDFAPNGTLLQVGDTITRHRYARTLQKIADEGPTPFYNGSIADSMIKTINEHNGTMDKTDLQGYKVLSQPTTNITYRGYKLHGIGAPASGAVTMSTLKTMEHYDPQTIDWTNPSHADLEHNSQMSLATHRFVEAMRFSYAARSELGDPFYVDGVDELEAEMLREENAELVKGKILDDRTQPVEAYNPKGIYTTDGDGTSHVVTADASGMAVSMTTTINLIFGALIMDPETGIILNNEMNDFSIPGVPNAFGYQPSEANFIRPGKRPLSSCTPVIVDLPEDGFHISVGAAGGSRIVSSTAQTLWHLLEHNLIMTEALRHPRLHDQLMPNHTTFEKGYDGFVVQGLRDRGHEVAWANGPLSSMQGILLNRTRDHAGRPAFEAVGEPRQRNSKGLTAFGHIPYEHRLVNQG